MKTVICLLILLICANSLPWAEQIALANSLQVGRDQNPDTWACTGCTAQNRPKSVYSIEENITNVRASVAVYSEYTVLAFRYTADLDNLISDIKFLVQKKDQHACSNCKVQKVWDQMWEAIKANTTRDLQAGDRSNKLILTGISLGGALAQLSYVDIQHLKIFTDIQIITFGQPRVGNPAWADWFNQKITTKRFFLSTDPIVSAPSCLTKLICEYKQTNIGYSCTKNDEVCVCRKSDKITTLEKVQQLKNWAKIVKGVKENQQDLQSILDHITGYKELYACTVMQ